MNQARNDGTTRGAHKPSEDDVNQAAKEVTEQLSGKSDSVEGQVVAQTINVDGPVFYMRRDGKDVPETYPEEEWKGFPDFWKDKYLNALHTVISAVNQIKTMEKRTMPLTEDEFFNDFGHTKKELKQLIKSGLVNSMSFPVYEKGKKDKPKHSKNFIYLTPQGHAYLRKLGENDNGSDQSQS